MFKRFLIISKQSLLAYLIISILFVSCSHANGINSNTLFMIDCDGVDGSTNFTDRSPTTPFTVTVNGNVQTDTAVNISPAFGGSACLFDGTGDFLQMVDNADWNFSDGVWSFDAWINLTSTVAQETIFARTLDSNNQLVFRVDAGGNIDLVFLDVGVVTINFTTAPNTILANTWYHVAIVENGSDFRIYVNGVERAQLTDDSRITNFAAPMNIGSRTVAGSEFPWSGSMDEIRFSTNAMYLTPFSRRASAYTSFETGAMPFLNNLF